MTLRRSGATCVLVVALILGLSCSGPSPETSGPSPTEDRPSEVYHVQLDMTERKVVANRKKSKALTWWEQNATMGTPTPIRGSGSNDDYPVAIVWKAPLYRVRLGPFATRSEAEDVLASARSVFPDAFIAPERLQASE